MRDGDLLRWAFAAAYAAAALLAFAASLKAARRDRIFWLCASGALLLLGLAKLFRLQEKLGGVMRGAAKTDGWYGLHREVQTVFLLIVAALAAAVAALLARWLRGSPGSVKAGSAGLLALLAFLSVRATSAHAVDVWTSAQLAGMRLGWWVELGAIALISAAALSYSATATGTE
jgi:hypothetical protein